MDGYCGLSLGCGTTVIDSKGTAIAFAVMLTMKTGRDNVRKVDYKEAQKLFDFITRNVTLPDIKGDPMADLAAKVGDVVGILEKVQAEKESRPEKEVLSS